MCFFSRYLFLNGKFEFLSSIPEDGSVFRADSKKINSIAQGNQKLARGRGIRTPLSIQQLKRSTKACGWGKQGVLRYKAIKYNTCMAICTLEPPPAYSRDMVARQGGGCPARVAGCQFLNTYEQLRTRKKPIALLFCQSFSFDHIICKGFQALDVPAQVADWQLRHY